MAPKFLKDEQILLDRVARGDAQAYTIIFNFYQARVYSFCLPILQEEVLAEEVVQEVFLKIWQMGPKVKAIKSLNVYLKTMSRNIAIDQLRRKQLQQRIQKDVHPDWSEEHNDTVESITLKETRALIERGIAELPPQQQRIYQYIYQEGLRMDQAANQMNIKVSTAQTHLKLAKRYLREYLQKHSDIAIIAIIFKLF